MEGPNDGYDGPSNEFNYDEMAEKVNKNFRGCNRHFKEQYFLKGFSLRWCDHIKTEENSIEILKSLGGESTNATALKDAANQELAGSVS